MPPRRIRDVLEMVLTGRITGDLVALLNAGGGRAVGVSGKDGPLLRAVPAASDAVAPGERMGEVREVNRGFLEMLLEKGYLPVIAPVGIGPSGETLHLTPTGAAAEVAIALGAPKLIYLQDATGIVDGGELRNQLDRSATSSISSPTGAVPAGASRRCTPSSARSPAAWSGCTSSTAGRRTASSPSSSPTTASARW